MKTKIIFCFLLIIALMVVFSCSEKNATAPTNSDKTNSDITLLKPAAAEFAEQKPAVTAIPENTRQTSIEDLPDVGDVEKKKCQLQPAMSGKLLTGFGILVASIRQQNLALIL